MILYAVRKERFSIFSFLHSCHHISAVTKLEAIQSFPELGLFSNKRPSDSWVSCTSGNVRKRNTAGTQSPGGLRGSCSAVGSMQPRTKGKALAKNRAHLPGGLAPGLTSLRRDHTCPRQNACAKAASEGAFPESDMGGRGWEPENRKPPQLQHSKPSASPNV